MTPITSGDIVARSLTVSSALVRPGDLRALEERALASGLTPLVTTFPLAEAAAAHAALEARETVGKVVLLPSPSPLHRAHDTSTAAG
jgi:NADPH2:quinone reductase